VNAGLLEEHLRVLSYGYSVEVTDDLSIIIARDFKLPPGWNQLVCPVLLEIPEDYPFAVPGRDSRLYLPTGLRFQGRCPSDYHEDDLFVDRPGWAWWCYQDISWDPSEDNLVRLLEMLRTDLTHPL